MFEENEAFEIVDYTTATDLERYISDLENLIKQWRLSDIPGHPNPSPNQPTDTDDSSFTEVLSFHAIDFLIEYHDSCLQLETDQEKNEGEIKPDCNEGEDDEESKYLDYLAYEGGQKKREEEEVEEGEEQDRHVNRLVNEMQNDDQDFAEKSTQHFLHKAYGLKQFITIRTAKDQDVIFSEEVVKMLISAVTIVVTNTGCVCPVFVQSSYLSRNLFQGVFVHSGIKFNFEMSHCNSYLRSMEHLLEMLDFFKEKISCPLQKKKLIQVNAKFTYEQNRFAKEFVCNWPLNSCTDFDPIILIEDAEKFRNLTLSASDEVLKSMRMSYIWKGSNDSIMKDSAYYSTAENLTPTFVQLQMKFDSNVRSIHFYALSQFLEINCKWLSNRPLVKQNEKDYTQVDARSALNRIVNRDAFDISFEESAGRSTAINQDFRNEMLNFIFASDEDIGGISEQLRQSSIADAILFKTCPPNSLSWRIAMLFAFVNFKYNSWEVVSLLWKDLTSQFRRFWESGEFIPDVEQIQSPQLEYGRFHQNLQMLNCCIAAKRRKQQKQTDDDTDEFYDCDDSEDEKFCDTVENSNGLQQAEGVLHKHEKLFLINHPNQLLNVPITQEAVPTTEHMMQEQMEVLERIAEQNVSNIKETSIIRAKLQCASLLSDMEAFKAANPGCCFEDFIRWHSPRDFIESEEEEEDERKDSLKPIKGRLSQRFSTEDNLWTQLWAEARAQPTSKQKLLFDYTKEAEKILHTFDKFTTNDLVDALLPIFAHYTWSKLDRAADELHLDDDVLRNQVVEQLKNSFWTKQHEKAIAALAPLEQILLRLHSLEEKLRFARLSKKARKTWESTVEESGKELLKSISLAPTIELTLGRDSKLPKLLRPFFVDTDSLESTAITRLKSPIRKEFYLRAHSPRPSVYSRELFQMLHCVVGKGEMRLCGCFLEDLVYF